MTGNVYEPIKALNRVRAAMMQTLLHRWKITKNRKRSRSASDRPWGGGRGQVTDREAVQSKLEMDGSSPFINPVAPPPYCPRWVHATCDLTSAGFQDLL